MSEKELMQGKLDMLIEKYGASPVVLDGETVSAYGRTAKLLPHRNERRFFELRSMVNNGTLEGVSALRFGVVSAGRPIKETVRRELDIARYIYGKEIAEITAFGRGDAAANVIATFEDGVVLTLEISALAQGSFNEVDKHEITCRRGVACDRAIDTQVPQDSIYLYTESGENAAYTDVDFELYGLTQDKVAVVRAAFDVAVNEAKMDEADRENAVLDALMCAYETSLAETRKVEVKCCGK